jgi:hypothetical protein
LLSPIDHFDTANHNHQKRNISDCLQAITANLKRVAGSNSEQDSGASPATGLALQRTSQNLDTRNPGTSGGKNKTTRDQSPEATIAKQLEEKRAAVASRIGTKPTSNQDVQVTGETNRHLERRKSSKKDTKDHF